MTLTNSIVRQGLGINNVSYKKGDGVNISVLRKKITAINVILSQNRLFSK